MLSEENQPLFSWRILNRALDRAREQGRREERERAIAVLRPFAEAAEELDDEDHDRNWLWEHPAAKLIEARDLRAASSYITQAQGE